MRLSWALCVVAIPLSAATAWGATDRFRVTPAEKAACSEDAVRLCISAYPDEDRLLSCMKQNRASLTSTCLAAFDAGVRRRHL